MPVDAPKASAAPNAAELRFAPISLYYSYDQGDQLVKFHPFHLHVSDITLFESKTTNHHLSTLPVVRMQTHFAVVILCKCAYKL